MERSRYSKNCFESKPSSGISLHSSDILRNGNSQSISTSICKGCSSHKREGRTYLSRKIHFNMNEILLFVVGLILLQSISSFASPLSASAQLETTNSRHNTRCKPSIAQIFILLRKSNRIAQSYSRRSHSKRSAVRTVDPGWQGVNDLLTSMICGMKNDRHAFNKRTDEILSGLQSVLYLIHDEMNAVDIPYKRLGHRVCDKVPVQKGGRLRHSVLTGFYELTEVFRHMCYHH